MCFGDTVGATYFYAADFAFSYQSIPSFRADIKYLAHLSDIHDIRILFQHIYCKPLLRELQTQNCCLHDRRIFSDELYPGSSYPNNIRLRGQHLGPLGNRKNECYRNNGGKLNTPHSPSAGYCSYLWFVSPLFHRQSV